MLKVGQIYKQKNGEIFAVSSLNVWIASMIYKDGYATSQDIDSNNKGFVFNKLIAEYPTWQEAINSPEFRGD